jgi:hypothetical protein
MTLGFHSESKEFISNCPKDAYPRYNISNEFTMIFYNPPVLILYSRVQPNLASCNLEFAQRSLIRDNGSIG